MLTDMGHYVFVFYLTKLEFVEMHEHIMKLCSASLELLYIKDVFKIAFCEHA
jgi:hypothetical protein